MKRLLTPLAVGLMILAAGDLQVSAKNPFGEARLGPVAIASANADRYREVTIPAGSRLTVRLNSSLSSNGSHLEQPVDATVIAPLKIGGTNVPLEGSHVGGDVTVAQRSGRVKGRARLTLQFRTLTVAGGGSYPITAQVSRIAPATKAQDAAKIGFPAAGGAVIGGLLGGKKGAAVGAAVGGGAGTAVVLSTRGKEVSLPRGSVVSLRLRDAVTARVPIR